MYFGMLVDNLKSHLIEQVGHPGRTPQVSLEWLEPRRLLSSTDIVDTTVDESDGDYSAGDLSLGGAQLEVTEDDTTEDLPLDQNGRARVLGALDGAVEWHNAPTDLDLDNSQVSENSANGTLVGTVTVSDVDAGDTHTFNLLDDVSGRFDINAVTGVVTVEDGSLLDHEMNSSHVITVQATDSGALSFSKDVTITISDVNEPILDLSLSHHIIATDALDGDSVASVIVTDDDLPDETHTFTLLDNAGGRFGIDANSGLITIENASLIDFANATSHQINVHVEDAAGHTLSKQFEIDVIPGVSFVVDTNVDESDGDYSEGDLSLREAIEISNHLWGRQTITFDTEVFNGGGVITLNGTLMEIVDDISIIGLEHDSIAIDANRQSRHFWIEEVSASLSHLKLQNGWTGGVVQSGGGSLWVDASDLRLSGMIFLGNSTNRTGHEFSWTNAGALRFIGGELYIENSTFSQNSSARDGGAIMTRFANSHIVNTTFSGNSSNNRGGAIAVFDATMTLENSTITGNDSQNGGGLYHGSNSSFTINNNLIAGNTSAGKTDIGGLPVTSGQYNLIGDADSAGGLIDGVDGNIVGVEGVGIRDINTVLDTTLRDNGGPTKTHALVNGSVAIDMGGDTYAVNAGLTTDQRSGSYSRFFGAAVDIGAFESRLYVVDTTVDESDGDYSAGDLSLREAIELANSDAAKDTIAFSTVVFDGGGTITLNGSDLDITEDLEIAASSGNEVTIDAENSTRIFYITNSAVVTLSDLNLLNARGGVLVWGATLTARHLSVKNGYAQDGAGIDIVNSTVTISGSVISENEADDDGAGVRILNSTVAISDTTIARNDAHSGGGVFLDDSSYLMMNQVNLSENSAWGSGAAIYSSESTVFLSGTVMDGNDGIGVYLNRTDATMDSSWLINNKSNSAIMAGGSELLISDTTISGNRSRFNSGAGINSQNSTLTIENSTISDNDRLRSHGGGLYMSGTTATLVNTTFSGNRAAYGGGIFINRDSEVSMVNLTFINNSATANSSRGGFGGAMHVYSNSTVSMHNSLLAGNIAGEFSDISGTLDFGSSNLISDSASSGGLTDGVNGNIVGVNGLGVLDITTILDTNLADNGGPTHTHALVAGSLALNSGDNSQVTEATDQRGLNRIVDGTVDIGAYENDANPIWHSPDRVQYVEGGNGPAYIVLADDAEDVTYDISRWDKDLFDINSTTGEITFKISPDFDNPADSNANNVYVLWVTATDTSGNSSGKAILIEVVPDEPPVLTSPDRVSFEQGASGPAYTIAATDQGPDDLTYSISRWDKALFDVDSLSGEVSFKTPPDYDSPQDSNANNVYVLWVSAKDTQGNEVGKAILIEVLPAASVASLITSPDRVTFTEGDTGPAYTISVSGGDGNLTYAISRWDKDLFSVDSETGVVSFINPPDYSNPLDANANNVYVLWVSVTDELGRVIGKGITIAVQSA